MKFHYKGCKFHELFESRNVRRAMANNLEKMKNAKAKEVKKKINNMLTTFENKNFDLMQNMVVNYLNSLYGDKAESKFKVVLDKLSKYRRLSNRDDLDLVKIIRYALRSIVFDHYSRLNYRTRKDLKLKLDAFWANLGIPEKEGHHIWQFKPLDGDEKLDEEHGDGSGSVEVELHKTNKKRKPKKTGRERNKQTTRKHLTFITLYPEVITTLKGKRHKTKSTKSSKHLREQESTKRLKDKSKKPRAVRKIISEHEAVIDVRRDTLSRIFAASVEILHPASKEVLETTIAPTSKAHKRHRPVQRVELHKKHPRLKKRQHPRTKKRHYLRTEKSRKNKRVHTAQTESNEGMSILSFESNEVVTTKSFRKSNLNDSLVSNDTTDSVDQNERWEELPRSTVDEILPTTIPVSVIRRISDLEKELRDVKAQINATNKEDSYEGPPVYETLDFWEGTTESQATTSTPILTTKGVSTTRSTAGTTTKTASTTTTTTTKPTTTTIKTTIKTAVRTTKKLTTKKVNNTDGAIFRSKNKNESEVNKKVTKWPDIVRLYNQPEPEQLDNIRLYNQPDKKVAVKQVSEKEGLENKEDIKSNVTELDELDPTKFNSSEVDYFNEKMPKNLTAMEMIERYLNDTKAIGGDKIQHVVRKQMMDDLGLFSENPEDANLTALLPSTPSMSDKAADPMNFLDDVGDTDLK
ncbi:hypothetical protein ABMA28_012454 [Loxostege sticticalis]|uniref:Uncharacterized protein n=1 Tax=Loxostege sticticalis TaxID=481309 RepID=A0ABD0S3X0_LOXSC